jgi:hypothetical protein
MTRLAPAIVVACLTTAAPLHAQADAITPAPGARVRVRQDSRTLTGTLLSQDAAGLVIVTGRADTVTAPRASITSVEVSTGTKSNVGKGALIGLGAGLGAGIIVGIAASGSDDGSWLDFSSGEWAAGIGATGAVLGAGIGAIVGAATRSDKWAPAVLPTVAIRGYGTDEQRVTLGLRITPGARHR